DFFIAGISLDNVDQLDLGGCFYHVNSAQCVLLDSRRSERRHSFRFTVRCSHRLFNHHRNVLTNPRSQHNVAGDSFGPRICGPPRKSNRSSCAYRLSLVVVYPPGSVAASQSGARTVRSMSSDHCFCGDYSLHFATAASARAKNSSRIRDPQSSVARLKSFSLRCRGRCEKRQKESVCRGSEMRKEFVLILVLFLAFSGSLLAQEEKTGYELGVFAAWQQWKSRAFQI